MMKDELPESWVLTPLSEAVDVLDSKRIPINADERERRVKDKNPQDLIPYYGATGQVGFIDEALFDEPLILLGEDGVPFYDPLKHKAYRVSGKTWVNNHAHVLRARTTMCDERFITAFLNSFDYTGYVTGSTRLKLTQGSMNSIPVSLAPLAEQKRIADKLEAVLGRVDACRARLDRVPDLLKRFRQSVLAAATSGQLTEDWREIRALPPWRIAKLSEVCVSITDGDHQAPPQVAEGIPFITISAINDGKLKVEKATRRVTRQYYEQLRDSRKPRRGDILYSVTGSIGVPALVDIDDAFTFQRHIAILRPNTDRVSSGYLLIALGADVTKQQAISIATGTAQLTIPLSGLREFDVPEPSPTEQTEIVRRVESLFTLADRIEGRLATAQRLVERLTPATLNKAFRGDLVPQDPNDEPASKLLERIANGKTALRKLSTI